jgi:formiminotetrahydrofolate cyclodeaminase
VITPRTFPSAVTHDDRTVGTFLTELAGEAVPPAGGTATAVVGAAGASLCGMVARHADGDVRVDGATAQATLDARRARLLTLADADAAVVDALFAGDGGPRERKRAVGVPLAIAEACGDVLAVGTAVVEQCEGPVVADAVTGVFLAHGALRAALFTLRTNLSSVADESFVAETEQRAAELEAAAVTAFGQATDGVDG